MRARLEVNGRELRSLGSGRAFEVGELELVRLETLRDRVCAVGGWPASCRSAM